MTTNVKYLTKLRPTHFHIEHWHKLPLRGFTMCKTYDTLNLRQNLWCFKPLICQHYTLHILVITRKTVSKLKSEYDIQKKQAATNRHIQG